MRGISWLTDKLFFLQHDWAMKSQSNIRIITVDYEKYEPGREKSETRTKSLVGITDEEDVIVDADVYENII